MPAATIGFFSSSTNANWMRPDASDEWTRLYASNPATWSQQPTPLFYFMLEQLGDRARGLSVLEAGCGYGRDALALADHGMQVLGVDVAGNAIAAAQGRAEQRKSPAEFACLDLGEVEGTFDVVYAANLYQVMDAETRSRFRRIVYGLLRPRGFFFLMSLSTSDPDDFGRGVPVPNEENTFRREKLLHFCTEEELRGDFGTFEIHALKERAYDEPHAGGAVHHHISWFLMARKP